MLVSFCIYLYLNSNLTHSLTHLTSIDYELDARGGSVAVCDEVDNVSTSNKATALVLTEEEKQLLSVEGIDLPTDMPLTKVRYTILSFHSLHVLMVYRLNRNI